eukprot:2879995-Alexandrium_andersonii.AAC.1
MGPPVPVDPGGHFLRRGLTAPIQLPSDDVPPGRAQMGGRKRLMARATSSALIQCQFPASRKTR